MFGCIFPGRPPAAASSFRQMDVAKWCLDVDGASGESRLGTGGDVDASHTRWCCNPQRHAPSSRAMLSIHVYPCRDQGGCRLLVGGNRSPGAWTGRVREHFCPRIPSAHLASAKRQSFLLDFSVVVQLRHGSAIHGLAVPRPYLE